MALTGWTFRTVMSVSTMDPRFRVDPDTMTVWDAALILRAHLTR
jgi:hypothetical protein